MPGIDHSVRAELVKLEETLWRAETRFDKELMDKLFAEDFYEIGRSGRVWSREELLQASADTINAVLPLDQLEVRKIANDIYQVTYNSQVTYGNTTEYARRSSIWQWVESGWMLRFHQGTPYSLGDRQ